MGPVFPYPIRRSNAGELLLSRKERKAAGGDPAAAPDDRPAAPIPADFGK